MKTLVNKVNPAIRITAPEIESYREFYTLQDKDFHYLFKMETWALVEEEQKPLEWSEEDKENLGLVIECIYKYYPEPVMKYKLKDWLKSLRPQPHWKPSEEQMKALLNAEGLLRKYRHIATASKLAELYEELKKPGVKEEPEYYQHFDPDC